MASLLAIYGVGVILLDMIKLLYPKIGKFKKFALFPLEHSTYNKICIHQSEAHAHMHSYI